MSITPVKAEPPIPQFFATPSTTSAGDTTSAKLNRVRTEILKRSDVTAQFPEVFGDSTLRVINAYVGPDESQEKELAENISDAFSRYISENLQSEMYKDEAIQSMCHELGMTCIKTLDSLPFSHSTARVEFRLDPEKQTAALEKLLGACGQVMQKFAEKNQDRLSRKEQEEISDFFAKRVPAAMQQGTVDWYRSSLEELYSRKETILKLDRPFIIKWIRDIVATHKKFAESLPPPVYKEGNSQGDTFAIKKGKQLRGYLHSTMHHLFVLPDGAGEKIEKISPLVQERLCSCLILATEKVLPKKTGDVVEDILNSSVESALLSCASARGIVNIGIDAQDRDVYASELFKEVASKKERSDEFVKALAKAHLEGDIELRKALALTEEAMYPLSKKEIEINSLRNIEMADNIDEMLRACETVGQEREEAPPTCFVAVGGAHLIATRSIPDRVVELLAKKGWTIEYLPPKKA